MNVAVIGIGHVGLVTGLVFASLGHRVVCLEINDDIRNDLNKGLSHIFEPGIEEMLRSSLRDKSIRFTESNSTSLEGTDIIFICVNTPLGEAGIDYHQLNAALDTVGKAIAVSDNTVTVVIKSTVVPGTTGGLVKNRLEAVSNKKCNNGFGLAVNPEFLREGSGIDDFLQSDRIVIGTDHQATRDILLSIYEPIESEKVVVSWSTAEFIKYYSNNLLSLLISFSNEMSNISRNDETIDFNDVLRGIKLDKRLSPIMKDKTRIEPGILSYLVPGPGFGGSCLPKDLEAFIHYARINGQESPILDSVVRTNQQQPRAIIDLITDRIGSLHGKRILGLGLAHKPNTNDIRQSKSIEIARLLLKAGAYVTLHDPIVNDKVTAVMKDDRALAFTDNWKDELETSQIVILLTPWHEYLQLSESMHSKKLNGKYLVDTRSFFDKTVFGNCHFVSI